MLDNRNIIIYNNSMDIDRIVNIVYFNLGTLALIAGLVSRFSKSKKAKRAAEVVMNSCVDVGSLIALIAEAETHSTFTAENKRDYVITRYLKEHPLNVDELSDIIATLVAFTKTVNINVAESDDKKEEGRENDTRGTDGVCRIAR